MGILNGDDMDIMLVASEIHRLVEKAIQLPAGSIFPVAYYRFLKLLTEWWQPKVSVELGVYAGGGSLHMCMGYPEGIVIGVDINAIQNDVSEMCDNFGFLHMDSVLAASEYKDIVGDVLVDILFIDTTHTYEQTMAEYNAWFPHLNVNAIIALDDLHRPGMMKAWHEIPGYHIQMDELHVCPDPLDGGFGVILYGS